MATRAAFHARPTPRAKDFSGCVNEADRLFHPTRFVTAFLRQARADGFELVSINVDYPDFPAIDIQRRTAEALLNEIFAGFCIGK